MCSLGGEPARDRGVRGIVVKYSNIVPLHIITSISPFILLILTITVASSPILIGESSAVPCDYQPGHGAERSIDIGSVFETMVGCTVHLCEWHQCADVINTRGKVAKW